MALAIGGDVHAVFFGIKRAHIETVRFTRWLIFESELTPARFDMLRIVRLHSDGILQTKLRWLLGVTAPVVSRMLKSLQQRGFVERERDTEDGRCRIVRLTKRGRRAVAIALRIITRNREAERSAARVVMGETQRPPVLRHEATATIRAAREKVGVFDGLLASVRKALEDRAPFHHPWRRLDEHMPVAYTRVVNGRIQYGDHDPLAELLELEKLA
jgi:DNA-binding MarR family transcriptional regulator